MNWFLNAKDLFQKQRQLQARLSELDTLAKAGIDVTHDRHKIIFELAAIKAKWTKILKKS